jgi:hypothetical protein
VQRPKRKVMDFRFVNGGYIDGINFTAGCAGRLTFRAWQVTKDAAGEPVRTPPGEHRCREACRDPARGPVPAA